MKRRTFLAGSAAVAGAVFTGAAPALSQGAAKTLRIVPISNLSGIDPILTTGQPVRNHGYQIYDTLFGLDEKFNVKPQMAEGHEVSDNGQTWTIKLRDGLKFHDGERVLASDCVASLKRWGERDPLGQTIFQLTNELTAIDDKTLQFRLRARFGLVTQGLAKIGGPAPFIMPARIAAASASTAIKEAIGSGPFKFLPDEWIPGSRAAYAKFEGYQPRNEPASGTAGGKVAYVDRLEWHIIPDAATATAALQRNEVDWYQSPDLTLLPILKQDKAITIEPFDDFGYMIVLRFNQLQKPFDNPKMRQVIQAAVNQIDYMQAAVGNPDLYRECKSFFFCGTPLSSGSGSEVMISNFDKAKAMLKDAGYSGEKIVIVSPTDLVWLHNASLVTEDLLKRLGLNVELQATDLGSFYNRRASVEPVDKGGWSIFHAGMSVTDIFDPSTHIGLRANGRQTWPGWPTDLEAERLRTQWMTAMGSSEQIAIAKKIEAHAFGSIPYVPLGQFQTPSAYRKNITGVLKAPMPIAWNVKKG